MRILVDTNVVIDVLQKRPPFFDDSYRVVTACACSDVEGWFTAKALTDVFYVMHRHYHKNEPCLDVIRKLFMLFSIADTTASCCLQASFSLVSDYEDAVMDETAKAIKADYIVTRNTSDFKNSSMPAMAPHDFVRLLDT